MADRLEMQTKDLTELNIEKISKLFPSCVTETKTDDGTTRLAVDFEALKRQFSGSVIPEEKERYVFTWPGKSESQRLANEPTNNTLRPCLEESVQFDRTKNIYIEGDNLEALKILRETYLGKIKMMYIDPPYNTGSDLVYDDDFSQSESDFSMISGDYDEDGNKLRLNTHSNGRFHTDWLNMIYPRIILAKDLLSDDGVMFISIDDNEIDNLKKVCSEVFGERAFVATFPWRKRTAKSDVPFGVSQDYEWIVCYAKSGFKASIEGKERKYYETPDLPGRPWRYHDLTKQTTASERPNSFFTIVNPKNGKEYPADPNATWRITKETLPSYLKENRIVFPGDYEFLKIKKPVLRYFKEDDEKKAGDDFGLVAVSTKFPDDIGMSKDGTKNITDLFERKVFSFPKPTSLIEYLIKISFGNQKNGIVMDFFAGSSTTSEALFNHNLKTGSDISFISVQIPEKCAEDSEAYKAGYKNICEIGRDRIKRAGKKLIEQQTLGDRVLDVGFRLFRIDSSNMNDVFYDPQSIRKDLLDYAADNIKSDRSGEDLLIQVMLELGIELSVDVQKETISGKNIFTVDGDYLIASFDNDVNDELVTEIAKRQPRYAVFRDSSMSSDAVAINFGEIFKTFSPNTQTKVL